MKLKITWALKDYLTKKVKHFGIAELAIGLIPGRECVYLKLEDGRRLRILIQEIPPEVKPHGNERRGTQAPGA